MIVLVTRDGREHRVDVAPREDGYAVTVDGREHRVEGSFGAEIRARIDDRPLEAFARRDGLDIVVELHGRAYVYRPRDSRAPKLARRRGAADLARGEVHAPMPGLIVDVLVQAGAAVESGQPVVIMEAMKMQNELVAPLQGRVVKISVAPGAAVDAGQLLITVEPKEA
jgi:glutaconyl-CoA/methylmalonyl-CoA decarboxylase subunit gamma